MLITLLFINLALTVYLLERNHRMSRSTAELVADLQALKVQGEKAKAEVLAKIAALETAVNNAGLITPEVEAALADLKTTQQSLDDIVGDDPQG